MKLFKTDNIEIVT